MAPGEFKRLRKLARLTQERAAALLQVSHRTVLRWEAGQCRIRPLMAEPIRQRLTQEIFHPSEGEAKENERGRPCRYRK